MCYEIKDYDVILTINNNTIFRVEPNLNVIGGAFLTNSGLIYGLKTYKF